MKELIVVRKAFTWFSEWKAMKELLRRGYKIQDRKRHFFWEWVAIMKIRN